MKTTRTVESLAPELVGLALSATPVLWLVQVAVCIWVQRQVLAGTELPKVVINQMVSKGVHDLKDPKESSYLIRGGLCPSSSFLYMNG